MSSRPRNPALPAKKCRSFPAVICLLGPIWVTENQSAGSCSISFCIEQTGKQELAPRTGFEPASYPFAEGCSPLRYRGMLGGAQPDVSTTLIYRPPPSAEVTLTQ